MRSKSDFNFQTEAMKGEEMVMVEMEKVVGKAKVEAKEAKVEKVAKVADD